MTQVKFITAEYSSHLEEKINKWLIHMNEKFDEFIQHFTGISKYIELKYFALKEEELSKKISIKKKKELFTWLTLVHYIITALFFILFFIFSILNITFYITLILLNFFALYPPNLHI